MFMKQFSIPLDTFFEKMVSFNNVHFIIIVALFLSCLEPVVCQTIDIQINLTDGLVWFLLVFIFSLVYGIPIIVWLHRVLISKLIVKAQKKIEHYSLRFSERMSSAGRKVSEQVRV